MEYHSELITRESIDGTFVEKVGSTELSAWIGSELTEGFFVHVLTDGFIITLSAADVNNAT